MSSLPPQRLRMNRSFPSAACRDWKETKIWVNLRENRGSTRKTLMKPKKTVENVKCLRATLFASSCVHLLGRIVADQFNLNRRRFHVVLEGRFAEGLHRKKAFMPRVFDTLIFRLVIVRNCKWVGIRNCRRRLEESGAEWCHEDKPWVLDKNCSHKSNKPPT